MYVRLFVLSTKQNKFTRGAQGGGLLTRHIATPWCPIPSRTWNTVLLRSFQTNVALKKYIMAYINACDTQRFWLDRQSNKSFLFAYLTNTHTTTTDILLKVYIILVKELNKGLAKYERNTYTKIWHRTAAHKCSPENNIIQNQNNKPERKAITKIVLHISSTMHY